MKKFITIQICGLLVVIFVFSDILIDFSLKVLINSETSSIECLGLADALFSSSKAAESANIPLISGEFAAMADFFSKGISWLEKTTVLLGVQILILSLCKSFIVKILAAFLWLRAFIPRFRALFIKLLLIYFLLNPGLTIIVSISHTLAKESKIELGDNLKKELSSNLELYKTKEQERTKSLAQLNAKHKAENHGKENWFDREDDKLVSYFDQFRDETQLIYKDSLAVLKSSNKDFVKKAFNLFTHVLVIFLLLPFGYLYSLRFTCNKILSCNMDLQSKKS